MVDEGRSRRPAVALAVDRVDFRAASPALPKSSSQARL
jgi:hypothetical protein